MGKYLLSIGVLALGVMPIAGVVSCGENPTKEKLVTSSDLQKEITRKKEVISKDLNGKTSEMTIKKVKIILKSKLDNKFDNLIKALVLKGIPVDGQLIVTSGSKEITITTSTLTPIVAKDLENAIIVNEAAIKKALNGKTSEMTIKKIRKVLKDNLDNKFDNLIDSLTLTSKQGGTLTVALGKNKDILIKTSTLTEISYVDITKSFKKVEGNKSNLFYMFNQFVIKNMPNNTASEAVKKNWSNANINWYFKKFGKKVKLDSKEFKEKATGEKMPEILAYYFTEVLQRFLQIETTNKNINYIKWWNQKTEVKLDFEFGGIKEVKFVKNTLK